jgi:hypothetical protein
MCYSTSTTPTVFTPFPDEPALSATQGELFPAYTFGNAMYSFSRQAVVTTTNALPIGTYNVGVCVSITLGSSGGGWAFSGTDGNGFTHTGLGKVAVMVAQ